MKDIFCNSAGKSILLNVAESVQRNKDYLGEIDGLIGDGDHGMNMNKGFSIFKSRLSEEEYSFTGGLELLGTLLFNEIGGSMGPIYGTVFMAMAEAGESYQEIGLKEFQMMLEKGLQALYEVVDARPGDKTIVDTLYPAVMSLRCSCDNQETFGEALKKMKTAAETGKDSTKDLIAKYGRSSRLGERSRGVLDAGAVSCGIILMAMADGIIHTIKSEEGILC